ncbi:MAG: hypothetical protein ABI456_19025 [Ktedonobacteraceae bacterium]|nr:hypothetical protein [Chloroflexota bacterium]
MDYRQQRWAYRQQRRANRRYHQHPLGRLGGGFFFIALAIAFFASSQHHGGWFVPILFIGLAFSGLFGSMSSFNRWGIYGGFHSFFWLLALALVILTGSWIWFLVAIGFSIILGALIRPIMAGMLGAGMLGATGMMNNQQPYQQPEQQPYQPPYQPEQTSYQPYQEGYQPPAQQPVETYQEGGQPRQYVQPEYEEPQVQYPQENRQELPPQQQ